MKVEINSKESTINLSQDTTIYTPFIKPYLFNNLISNNFNSYFVLVFCVI